MPRRLRLDAPGMLHHVYVRGIDRRDLFLDDDDRVFHLALLSRVVPEECAECLAWVLMSNHAHYLVRTGTTPLARVMHRIGTAYGKYFNDRYGGTGYVFQGRYGAVAVTDDAQALATLRYVHRNPLDAGLVPSLAALARYRWGGHGALVGASAPEPFHDVAAALALFGEDPDAARERLVEWMEDGAREPEDTAPAELALAVLIAAVCAELGVSERAVRSGVRGRAETGAREAIARRARSELGLGRPVVARALGVTRQALWRRERVRP